MEKVKRFLIFEGISQYGALHVMMDKLEQYLKNNTHMEINRISTETDDIIPEFWKENYDYILKLVSIFSFPELPEDTSLKGAAALFGKKFCITGKLHVFANRDELVADIEAKSGKVVSGVTKATDYLITNDKNSGSSKNKKAAELNIPIISEEEYINLEK